MQVPQSSENLAAAWAEAVAAAVFAPLSIATEATAAAASMWTATLTKPVEANAAPFDHEPPAARVFAPERYNKPRAFAADPAPRSWYRAPYRSPFDPMFWLQPGHPVDHLPETVASAMQLSMFGNWPGAGSWLAPAMSGLLPKWLAGQPEAWAVPAWNPWAFAMPAQTTWDIPKLPPNVIEFNSAYAAYRTAGGHAAAQIVRGTVPDEQTARVASQVVRSSALAWPFGLMLPPWMSK